MKKSKYQKHRKIEDIVADLKQNSISIRDLYAQLKNEPDPILKQVIEHKILYQKEHGVALHWEYRAAKEHSLVVNMNLLLGNFHVSEDQIEKRIRRVEQRINEAANQEEYSIE